MPLLLLAVAFPARAQSQQPCPVPGDCAGILIEAPATASRGDLVSVAVHFQPGPSDGIAGGLDDITALTFSLAIPGLELADCTNPTGDGLTAAISVSPQVDPQFRVIVENTACDDNPARPCLCPGPGQTRAPYLNFAVFGPKSAPGQNPQTLPSLPEGVLAQISLRVRADAASSLVLHALNQADSPAAFPKPPFGAQASVGDTMGVDLSADFAGGVSRIRVGDAQIGVADPATPTRTLTPTRSLTPTRTFTPTRTGTATPDFTASHTATPGGVSPTPTPEATPTATASHTADPTATMVPPTPTLPPPSPTAPSPTAMVPSPTQTSLAPVTPTATAPPSQTATATQGGGETPVPTPVPSTPTPTSSSCPSSCDATGSLSVADLKLGVRIALLEIPVGECSSLNTNGDNSVTVDELVAATKASLDFCP